MTTPVHLLNAEAFVMSQQWVSDGRGGQRETFVPRTVNPVRTMIAQPTDNDRVAAGAAGADIDARLYFEPDVDVEIGDHVAVVDDVEGAWRVEVVVQDSRKTLKRALCSRRQIEDGGA